MAIDTVIHTNQHSIDRVMGAGAPVLLVFWHPKAPLSTQNDADLDRLAADHAGRALIAKIDAAEETELRQRFNVTSVPTFVFVNRGQLLATTTGVSSAENLGAWLSFMSEGGSKPDLPEGPSATIPDGAPSGGATYANGRGPDRPAAGAAMPVTLTDANFQSAVNRSEPVLVDFWAPWCGPCRMVAPAVEQLAQEFEGRATVGKLNVDENQQTAARYGIMSIPALYVFKNGEVMERIVGAQPVQSLREALSRHID